MVHTRFSEPEDVLDDPIVEIHESQLRRLRARANLAIPGVILGLVALALVGAGVVRVERAVNSMDGLAAARNAALAAQVDALRGQLAERTDPSRIARLAEQASEGSIAHASSTARQALSAAREAAASVVPVSEHLAVVDSGLAGMRADLRGLSDAGAKRGEQLAQVSEGLGALKASSDRRLESLDDKMKTHDALLRQQDLEGRSTKNWTRVVGAGTAVALAIVGVHTLGHGGR